MGNRLSRRQYAPAETAATEYKPSVEPASSKAKDSAKAQTQEMDQPESRGATEEPEMSDACLTEEMECVSKCEEEEEEEESPAAPAPAVHGTLMEPQEATEPNPVAEVHPAPEPAPDTSFLEADPEETSEPSSEPEAPPTEALEETDLGTQELLPESASPSSLIVPDVTPTPVLALSGSSGASATEGSDGEANAVEVFTAEPEASTEFLDNTQVEDAESMETLGRDVIESVFKNAELKGNDLLSDLIPGDVNIFDDTPITDVTGQLI